MERIRRFTAQNRNAWNEIAEVRYAHSKPGASFFAAGGSTLAQVELDAVGAVQSRTLLHLQCATGEETLSWAAKGARATGVDISDRQIEIAREVAAEAGLEVSFFACDVYDLPSQLQNQSFDIVYTSGGVLCWLPELDPWASVIAGALRPDGLFLLYEEHPLTACMAVDRGIVRMEDDYFSRSKPFEGAGWAHFNGAENAKENKFEFGWPLGDVVTAIADAGLRVETLVEYPSDARWRFGEQLEGLSKIPGKFLLVARTPS